MDLSAEYDTVNHRILIKKLYKTTKNSNLCRVIQNMLSRRRFYVILNERRRWRNRWNGSPQEKSHQGSVLFSILFNIYTNNQPHHSITRNLLYADDLCVTVQHPSFKQTENTIKNALGEQTETIVCVQTQTIHKLQRST